MFMYRFKFFFFRVPQIIQRVTYQKRRERRYDIVFMIELTYKARKIMNSYETNDSTFFYFFLFVFQESLVEAEIGRQKPTSDEEHQKIDSGIDITQKNSD